jgi:glycine cleavage system H lipoate-binding protein
MGTPGVVFAFRVVQTVSGTIVSMVDEAVDSTTPDTAFRWDPTGQQWIFNMNTKSLSANMTYVYLVTLNDGSSIQFQFGLR